MSEKAKLEGKVKSYCSKAYQKAIDQYNQRFNQLLFDDATMNLSIGRCNLLIDDAMAICKSPYHSLSRNQWNCECWKFLSAFTERRKA